MTPQEKVSLFCLEHYPLCDDAEQARMVHLLESVTSCNSLVEDEKRKWFGYGMQDIMCHPMKDEWMNEQFNGFKSQHPELFLPDAGKGVDLDVLWKRFMKEGCALSDLVQFKWLKSQPEFQKGGEGCQK